MAAPTLITATPPASLASRSCSFSRSQSESVVSISLRIWAARSATASSEPPPSTMVVSSLVTVDPAGACPAPRGPTSDSFRPTSAETTSAPVTIGQVLHERLAAVAEERRLDRDDGERLADRVDHQGGQGLALDVLGDDQQRLLGLERPSPAAAAGRPAREIFSRTSST